MSVESKPISITGQPQSVVLGHDDVVADSDEENPSRGFLIFNAVPSWLASFLLNTSLILILALFAVTTEEKSTISLEANDIEPASIDDSNFNLEDLKLDSSNPLVSELTEPPARQPKPEMEQLTIDTDFTSDDATLMASDTTSFEGAVFDQLSVSDTTNEISGRSTNSRVALLGKYGGNAASEHSVDLALQWIADHQLPDGGWNLDHTIGPKVNDRPRTSPNAGDMPDARFAATALALLPFLGQGHTHQNGKYKKVVFDGLAWLMTRAPPVRGSKGLAYWDTGGRAPMYSHGLVTIVLGETYAMTGDEKIRDFLVESLKFIESCQDPVGGGWRYGYRDRGDTSVVGWQIMALKSGKLSGIPLQKSTFKLANSFLDSVSTDYGAYYGYDAKPTKSRQSDSDIEQFRSHNRARTAIGLLCRMYLGWDREREGIVRGIDWISSDALGPDTSAKDREIDMYYNYYATQVMKHYGGEKWQRWNVEMRDFLVESQSKDGVTKGSWMFNPDGDAELSGGRLYVTSLACMTLEVYYRFLPLYGDDVLDDEFPLD